MERVMRRLFILAAVVLFGFIPLTGRVAAQESTPPAEGEGDQGFQFGPNSGRWDAVSRPQPLVGQQTSFDGSVFQPYAISFNEQYASVPQITDVEFMVVEIESGAFALEIPANGMFVVDRPDGSPIEYLQIVQNEPYYLPTGMFVLNDSGSPCTNMCAIPVGKAVQLQAGDQTIALADSICIWCLLHQPGAVVDQGLMHVYVLLEVDDRGNRRTFSWITDWDQNQGPAGTPEPGGTPEVRASSGALAWALFNPQARCRSGGP
jgi:hypothetical protein